MGRIRKYYEASFARMLPPAEVALAFSRIDALASELAISPALAMALHHAAIRKRCGSTDAFPKTFLCDAGLGGLARWLRGAGYEAHWNPSLDDAAVIHESQRLSATLITTDTLMMDRGVLRDGIVPAVFAPSSIHCEEQLLVVLRELGLSLRDSRCMNCGGELRRVEKSAVSERIPPRTAKWLDEYFMCAQCNHLFWRGTHWQKITTKLRELERSSATNAASDSP